MTSKPSDPQLLTIKENGVKYLAGRLTRDDAPPPIARPRNVHAERPAGQQLRVAAGGMVTLVARCRLNECCYFDVDHSRRVHHSGPDH